MKGSQSVGRGWKAYSLGDIAQAEAEFVKAVGESPQAAYSHLQQGLFMLRQDRFDEASRLFVQAAEHEPQNPAPLFFLTLARELEEEPELADSGLDRLIGLCPRHQGLASLRLLKELRRGDPLPALTVLGFGDSASKRGGGWRELAAGIGVGDPAWLPPDLSSSEYLMGPILVEIEKRLLPRELPQLEYRAGDLLTEMETLPPPKRNLTEELRALGSSWKSGPKLRKGRRLLSKALEIDPLDEQRAQLDKAIALLEEGQRLDPFSFRTSYHLGEAYLFRAKTPPGTPYLREQLLRAESYFLESTRIDGVNPYVLFFLALASQLLGRPKTAVECYRKATEKFTKLPEAHYGMGQCHLLLEQPSLAREMLLRAVNSDLALAKERLNLFANLLREEGASAFVLPLPRMPAEPLPTDLPAVPEITPAQPAFEAPPTEELELAFEATPTPESEHPPASNESAAPGH